MVFFNLSNLVTPEEVADVKNEAAIKTHPDQHLSNDTISNIKNPENIFPNTITLQDKPSFRDLVKKKLEEHATKTDNSKITSESNLLQAPKEPIQIEFKPALKLELSKSQEPQVSKVNDVQLEVKKPEEIKSEEDLLGGQTEGTFFLKSMLTDFSQILSAGKALEKYQNEMEEARKDVTDLKEKNNKARIEKEKIRNNLMDLLSNESENPDLLNNTLSSYDKYLEAVENSYRTILKTSEVKEDTFVTEIQKKRLEISALMKKIGGTKIFEEIKAVVTFCKEQRIGALRDKGVENIDEAFKTELTEKVNSFVEGDLHGAVMLAQGNDLIGILMRVYGAPEKDKK